MLFHVWILLLISLLELFILFLKDHYFLSWNIDSSLARKALCRRTVSTTCCHTRVFTKNRLTTQWSFGLFIMIHPFSSETSRGEAEYAPCLPGSDVLLWKLRRLQNHPMRTQKRIKMVQLQKDSGQIKEKHNSSWGGLSAVSATESKRSRQRSKGTLLAHTTMGALSQLNLMGNSKFRSVEDAKTFLICSSQGFHKCTDSDWKASPAASAGVFRELIWRREYYRACISVCHRTLCNDMKKNDCVSLAK